MLPDYFTSAFPVKFYRVIISDSVKRPKHPQPKEKDALLARQGARQQLRNCQPPVRQRLGGALPRHDRKAVRCSGVYAGRFVCDRKAKTGMVKIPKNKKTAFSSG